MAYSTHLLRHLRFTIGQNIQRARVRRRITLSALGRRAGMAPERIDAFEIGKFDIRLEDTLRLACALGVAPEALLASGMQAGERPVTPAA